MPVFLSFPGAEHPHKKIGWDPNWGDFSGCFSLCLYASFGLDKNSGWRLDTLSNSQRLSDHRLFLCFEWFPSLPHIPIPHHKRILFLLVFWRLGSGCFDPPSPACTPALFAFFRSLSLSLSLFFFFSSLSLSSGVVELTQTNPKGFRFKDRYLVLLL